MQTPEGQTYGPVPRKEMDRWVAEGRATADCRLRAAESDPWRNADYFYPDLAPDAKPTAGRSPFESHSDQSTLHPLPQTTNPFSESPHQSQPTLPSHQVTHRGGVVLCLGILSWLFCGCLFFGVAAWMMGNTDLREMREGRMDTNGMGLTHAGQILGMVSVIVWILLAMLTVFGMLMSGVG